MKESRGEVPTIVFHSNGRHMSQNKVRRVFSRILKKAKLPADFYPHCLRHSHATHALEAGAAIQKVSKQLGHSRINITVDTYGHIQPGSIDYLDQLSISHPIRTRNNDATKKPAVSSGL
jgi:site-specific recombinase XerD